MKVVSLSGSPRENVGKKDASALRAAGQVPCVIYGGKEQVHFSIDAIALGKVVYTPEVYKIEVEVAGKTYSTILKDLQFHPVTDAVIHADFLELIPGKAIKAELPVRISGNSIGVRNGGRLAVNFRRLQVMGVPENFPEAIEVDITKLRIGQDIRIQDVQTEGLTFLHNPKAVVVGVKRARGAVDTGEEEEGEVAEAAAEEGTAES